MTDIKNIKAGIAIASPNELKLSVIGERLKDYENQFNDLFLQIINASVGHDQWGVWFKQVDESIPKFIVDIYTNDINDFKLIYKIISQTRAGDIKLEMMEPRWNFQQFLEETA
jgi:hypothetical protein